MELKIESVVEERGKQDRNFLPPLVYPTIYVNNAPINIHFTQLNIIGSHYHFISGSCGELESDGLSLSVSCLGKAPELSETRLNQLRSNICRLISSCHAQFKVYGNW